MRAGLSLRPWSLALYTSVLLVACSSPPIKKSDGGSTSAGSCSVDSDCTGDQLCVAGSCKDNACDPMQMPDGCPDDTIYRCDELTLKCVLRTDGGTPNDGGNDGGSTGGCSSKYDCGDGQICAGGQCQAASSSCVRDDQCPKGSVCNFSHMCEPGCSSDKDCNAPQICNQSTVTCEVCSRTNPCPGGQTCANGACVAQVSCSAATDCQGTQAGLVCTGGQCANCTQDTDCNTAPFGSDYVCSSNGLCVAGGCTDAACQQQFGPKAYCDTTSKSCQQYQCVSDSDCASSGQTCDLGTHTCGSGQTCDMNTCTQTCAAQGMQCDPTTCGCGGGGMMTCTTPGTGMMGDACMTDCDCSSGLACDTANTLTCIQRGSGVPGTKCMSDVDCASGNMCIDTILFGTVCAQSCMADSDCPSGQPCCPTLMGQTVCSTLGPKCLGM